MQPEPDWRDTGISAADECTGESLRAFCWCGCLRLDHRFWHSFKREFFYYAPDGSMFRYEHELLDYLDSLDLHTTGGAE